MVDLGHARNYSERMGTRGTHTLRINCFSLFPLVFTVVPFSGFYIACWHLILKSYVEPTVQSSDLFRMCLSFCTPLVLPQQCCIIYGAASHPQNLCGAASHPQNLCSLVLLTLPQGLSCKMQNLSFTFFYSVGLRGTYAQLTCQTEN